MQEAKAEFPNLHPDEQPRALKQILQSDSSTPEELSILLAKKGNYTINGFFGLVWKDEWELIDQLIEREVQFGPQHFFPAYSERPLMTGLYYLFLKKQNALLRKLVKPGMLEYIVWENYGYPLKDFMQHLRKTGDEDSVAFWQLRIPNEKFEKINYALYSSYSVKLNYFLEDCKQNLQKYITAAFCFMNDIYLPLDIVTQIIPYMMGEFSHGAEIRDLKNDITSTQGIREHILLEVKKQRSIIIENLAQRIVTVYESNYRFGNSPVIDRAYLKAVSNHIVYFLNAIEFSMIVRVDFQKKLTEYFFYSAEYGFLFERMSLLKNLYDEYKIPQPLRSFDHKVPDRNFIKTEELIDCSVLLSFRDQPDSKTSVIHRKNSSVMDVDGLTEMPAPQEFAQLDFETQKSLLFSHIDKITFDHLFCESKINQPENMRTCLDRLSENNEWGLIKQLVDRNILKLFHFGHSSYRRPTNVWRNLFATRQNDILKALFDSSLVDIYNWPLEVRGFLAQFARSGNEKLFTYWVSQFSYSGGGLRYHVNGGVDYNNEDEQWIIAFTKKINLKKEQPRRWQNHIQTLTEFLIQSYSDYFDTSLGCPGELYLKALGKWLLDILSSIELPIILSKPKLEENLFTFFTENAQKRMKFTKKSLEEGCALTIGFTS